MLNRVRTIDGCIAWIKEQDNQTALTKTALRSMVIKGLIPTVMVGNKYLINLDTLLVYLQGETPKAAPNEIRRLNERL